jgi:hypothetical protein
MGRFIVTSLLSAAAFCLLLPHISGFNFAGGIFAALGLALLTSATAVFMKAIGRATTLTLRIRTVGRATAVLLPIWLVGIWLVPALELKLVAALFPSMLALETWFAAPLAAFALLSINAATNNWSMTLKKPCECG